LRKEVGQPEDSGRLERRRTDAEAVGTREREIQRLQENDAQWQVQTQKLNSTGQMHTPSSFRLRCATLNRQRELRNDMEAHCKPGELQDVLDQTEAARNELQIAFLA
jgi:hypothetical protein